MTDFHRHCRDLLVADGWGFYSSHLRRAERVTAFRGGSLEKFNCPTAFEAWAQALTFAQIQSEIDRLNVSPIAAE
jgi:hypothetical protein